MGVCRIWDHIYCCNSITLVNQTGATAATAQFGTYAPGGALQAMAVSDDGVWLFIAVDGKSQADRKNDRTR